MHPRIGSARRVRRPRAGPQRTGMQDPATMPSRATSACAMCYGPTHHQPQGGLWMAINVAPFSCNPERSIAKASAWPDSSRARLLPSSAHFIRLQGCALARAATQCRAAFQRYSAMPTGSTQHADFAAAGQPDGKRHRPSLTTVFPAAWFVPGPPGAIQRLQNHSALDASHQDRASWHRLKRPLPSVRRGCGAGAEPHCLDHGGNAGA